MTVSSWRSCCSMNHSHVSQAVMIAIINPNRIFEVRLLTLRCRTLALTGAGPVTSKMKTPRQTGVQCRAVVRQDSHGL